MDEDKWMKQLSAYRIGEDWMDSGSIRELQLINGVTDRHNKSVEWKDVERRNLISAELAKSTLGGLTLANCEVMDGDLARMDVWTDGENASKTMSNLTVHTREREGTSHCTHSFVEYCECDIGESVSSAVPE